LLRRLGPARRIAPGTDESNVFTRFHSPEEVRAIVPAGSELVAARGVRIVTPAAAFMRVPLVRDALRATERALCDSPLAAFGGFWIAAIAKR
jgi:hypothetical protein